MTVGVGQVLGAGTAIGLAVGASAGLVAVLVEAVWTRRARSVALGAMAGAAAGDALLAAIGGSLGWAIVAMVGDQGTRATIAVALFVAVAARLVLGLVIGTWAVPRDADLPTRPLMTAARFGVIELLTVVPALIAAASVVAWPRLWAFESSWAFVAGIAAGASAVRLGWATRRRPRLRSRWRHGDGLAVAAILLLVALAVGAFPR